MRNKEDENYVYYLVGQNLKRIRKAKGLDVSRLAYLSHYSEGTIKNIESPNYLKTFSLGMLWNFANVLNVDIKEFFNSLD